MSDLVLSTFCMNAGFDRPNDVLLKKLGEYDWFDRILICDGRLTEQAREYYSQFKNVEVFDMPWNDDYVRRYKHNAALTEKGDWILHLDSDEICSPELVDYLKIREYEYGPDANIIGIPCILNITEDYKKYYAVEPRPKEKYEGQWVKWILYKNDKTLNFDYFGSHVLPQNTIRSYCSAPYLHMKSLKSFVENDVYQMYLSPGGQGLTEIEAARFKMLTCVYKNAKDFIQAAKEGKWPLALQKFAYEHQYIDRPISRLSWYYFGDEFCNNMWYYGRHFPVWEHDKQFVLSKECNELYEKNIKEGNFIEVL